MKDELTITVKDELIITQTPTPEAEPEPTCGACIAIKAGATNVGFHTCEDDEDPRYCTLRPVGPQIICKRADPENRSPGGILLPDSAKKKTRKGVVIRVGPGQRLNDGKRATPEVKAGDRVVFAQYAGNEVTHMEAHGKEEYLLLQEGEILTVEEPDAKVIIPELE